MASMNICLHARIDLNIKFILFPHLRGSQERGFIHQFSNVIKDLCHSSKAVGPPTVVA